MELDRSCSTVLRGIVMLLLVGGSLSTIEAQDFPEAKVLRDDFSNGILEQGEIVGRETDVVRCLVQSDQPGGVAIVWLIPAGTLVAEGELLVELDDSRLRERYEATQIEFKAAQAVVERAQHAVQQSELAQQQYVEGILPTKKFELETELLLAMNEQRVAQRTLEGLQEITDASDEAIGDAEKAVELAERLVQLAQMKQETFESFEQPKQQADLQEAVETAKTALRIALQRADSEQRTLEKLDAQLASCQVVARRDGVVSYDVGGRRVPVIEEGALVRFNQPILTVTGLGQFDVAFKLHESQVKDVSPGMKATVRVAALGQQQLEGVVKEVSTVPAQQSFLTPELVEYEARIELDADGQQLRPGMVAEVSIVAESFEDVLLVPLQAIREFEGEYFCLVKNGEDWETRWLQLIGNDGKRVAIRRGLMDGETVALSPTAEAFDQAVIRRSVRPRPRSPRDNPEKTGTPGVVSKSFDTFDRNGNGKLEITELPAMIRRQMEQLDLNGDQSVDREELEAWMQRNRRRGPRGD